MGREDRLVVGRRTRGVSWPSNHQMEGVVDTCSSFPLTYDAPVNEDLVSFVRLLMVDSEWERAERKGKRPHAIMDHSTAGTVVAAIKARQSRYGGSIQVSRIRRYHDESLMTRMI